MNGKLRLLARCNRLDYLLAKRIGELIAKHGRLALPLDMLAVHSDARYCMYYVDSAIYTGYLYDYDVLRYFTGQIGLGRDCLYLITRGMPRKSDIIGRLVTL